MDPQELTQVPGAEEEAPGPEIEEKKPLTVDLAAAEEDDDEEKQPAERERGPRRKSDWRKMKESHASEMAKLREQIAELSGRISERQAPVHAPAPPPDKQADPLKQKIRTVRNQQQALLTMIQNAQTEEDRRQFTEQYHDLDEERIALVAESKAPKRQEAMPITPDAVSYMTLAGEYPEIYENEELRLEAQVEMAKLMRRHHKPRNITTAREACARVMAANGLGRKVPPPTDTERSRYSSVPARGSASNGASSNYQPNKYQMSMARAFTAHMPDMSDHDRFVYWARATKARENGLL